MSKTCPITQKNVPKKHKVCAVVAEEIALYQKLRKSSVKENFQVMHSINNTKRTYPYSQVETTILQYELHAESINI